MGAWLFSLVLVQAVSKPVKRFPFSAKLQPVYERAFSQRELGLQERRSPGPSGWCARPRTAIVRGGRLRWWSASASLRKRPFRRHRRWASTSTYTGALRRRTRRCRAAWARLGPWKRWSLRRTSMTATCHRRSPSRLAGIPAQRPVEPKPARGLFEPPEAPTQEPIRELGQKMEMYLMERRGGVAPGASAGRTRRGSSSSLARWRSTKSPWKCACAGLGVETGRGGGAYRPILRAGAPSDNASAAPDKRVVGGAVILRESDMARFEVWESWLIALPLGVVT
jgi:hypothetical protein